MKWFEIQRRRLHAEGDRELKKLPKPATLEEQSAAIAPTFERLTQLFKEYLAQAEKINGTFGQVPFNPAAFGYLHPSPESQAAKADPLVLNLHWQRHGESLESAYAKDALKDVKAYQRIARTGLDERLIVFGQERLKPFKSDELHATLLELIIAWQIEPLTADERAACFEEYCPCGRRKGHAADALKKQNARLRRKLGLSPTQTRMRGPAKPESEG